MKVFPTFFKLPLIVLVLLVLFCIWLSSLFCMHGLLARHARFILRQELLDSGKELFQHLLWLAFIDN
jgi:hypothetical protein